MAQKKQKRVRAKTKISPAGAAKLYKQESMRQFKSDMSDVKRVLKKYGNKADLEKLKKTYGKAARAKVAKKSVAKKGIARAVGKAVGRVTPAAVLGKLAHDVMRAGSKKGCIKRGGEWVGSGVKGRCKVAKKTKKTGGPDPRFAKSRRTKSKK